MCGCHRRGHEGVGPGVLWRWAVSWLTQNDGKGLTDWFRYFLRGGGAGGGGKALFLSCENGKPAEVACCGSEPAALQHRHTTPSLTLRHVGPSVPRFLLEQQRRLRPSNDCAHGRRGWARRGHVVPCWKLFPAYSMKLFFRIKFENLHYRTVGRDFPFTTVFTRV